MSFLEEKSKAVAFEVWFRPVVQNARAPNFSPLRGDKKNISKEYLIKKLNEAEIRKKVCSRKTFLFVLEK